MKEIIGIETIHYEIERLRPIWDDIKKKIESDIDNPSFAELIVRYNADEKYFLRIVDELINMYEGYVKIANKIISQEQPITKEKKSREIIEEDEEDLKNSDEETDDTINKEEIIFENKPLKPIPKGKAGRPKKNVTQE